MSASAAPMVDEEVNVDEAGGLENAEDKGGQSPESRRSRISCGSNPPRLQHSPLHGSNISLSATATPVALSAGGKSSLVPSSRAWT